MAIDDVLDMLHCPLCQQALTRNGGSVGCPDRHSFDLARQGYLNLLGRSAPTNADTAPMVAARMSLLASGAYAPIARAVTDLVAATKPQRWLEVGAGTGYYLAYGLSALGGRGVALDVSAMAARRAARAHQHLGAVVADVWSGLPLQDGCVDALLAVFAPRNVSEFARVLARDGLLVITAPSHEHHQELRGPLGLMDIPPDKDTRLASDLAGHFEPVTSTSCRYTLELDAETVLDLVSMGPNAFHTHPDQLHARVADLLTPIRVSVAVSVSAWKPLPSR